MKSSLYRLRHLIEVFLSYSSFYIMSFFPIDAASWMLGKLGPLVGYFFRRGNRVARTNLKACYPNMSSAEKQKLLKKMWQHLGRVAGEIPHWWRVDQKEFFKRVKISSNYPEEFFKQSIFLTAHLGNWEIFNKLLAELNIKTVCIEKVMHNKLVHRLLKKVRAKSSAIILPNTGNQTRKILKAIAEGYSLGMVIDQRVDSGKIVPFFGLPAKSGLLYAKIAVDYNLPIILMKCIRRDDTAYYDISFEKIDILPEYKMYPEKCVEKIHLILEKWIRQHPEQWLWTHRRFDIAY